MIGAPKSGTKMSLNSVKENVIPENGDKVCTEFGDKQGNSPNSVMNSSLAGIGHIYDNLIVCSKLEMDESVLFIRTC